MFVASVLLALALSACQPADESETAPAPIRPVRVVTVDELPGGEKVILTGTIQAQDDVSLGFRVGGQLIERTVNVGDPVSAGQVVARLDAQTERNAVDAARANLAAAMARLVEARNTVQRYQPMLERGFVARAQFDRAVEARDAAQAQVDAVTAQVATAENQLGFTTLTADGPGIVTARGAEPGEVVAAGQMIVRLAREGGRDAVFDVPARVIETASAENEVLVTLSTNPGVTATGRVREVSPEADPATRTFKVRVGLANPPEAMRLGSTVTGTVQLGGTAGIAVPAAALTSSGGQPAVWVLDPGTETVALRNVDVVRHELDRVVVGQGLDVGEIVVTAGVQTLRPGQQVRLAGAPPPPAPDSEPALEVVPQTEPEPAGPSEARDQAAERAKGQ